MKQIYDFIYDLASKNVSQHRTMTFSHLAALLNQIFGKTYSMNPSKVRGLARVVSLAADAQHNLGCSSKAFEIERFFVTVSGRHLHG